MKIKSLFLIVYLGIFLFYNNIKGQNYNIKHCEPPFWWTEMNNQQLQIMVHGENIAFLNPEIHSPGINIEKLLRTDNQNFLFIYIEISNQTKPGSFDIIFKNEDKTELIYNYRLLDRDIKSAERTGFNNSDVIYLIMPDRFANGNPDNDNIIGYPDKADRRKNTGRHGGDIQGIIEHLDYISDIGYTSIWVNPLLENNMKRVSYHGYSTTDYYKIDPRFGSNEDYKKLCIEAEKRGVKIIMDQIMNHCGLEHWWMKDLPAKDWINNMDNYQQTSHRRTTLHDPYSTESDKEKFIEGWFVPSMPDLNQKNKLLADYLIQNCIWWIEYAGIKGVRHDTQPYAGIEFMTEWACRIMNEYPNFNIVGEEWSENPIVLAKWQKGKENPDNNASCLPSLMDFPLQISFNKALTDHESWNSGLFKVYEMLANDIVYPDPYNLVIFPDNHDMSRIFTQLNEDFDLFKIAIAFYLTTRGIPQIFYGTEILMKNLGTTEHGIIRSDYPGGWKGDKINAFENNGLSPQQSEARDFMKKLLNWRKNNPVIHTGKLKHYAPEKGVYIYFRYNDEKRIMVILNKNNNEVSLNYNRYYEMLAGYTYGTDILNNVSYELKDLNIPARSPMILELK